MWCACSSPTARSATSTSPPTLDTGPFATLRDPETFAKAHVGPVTGGLEWTDEIGLDPDVLYATLDLGPGFRPQVCGIQQLALGVVDVARC